MTVGSRYHQDASVFEAIRLPLKPSSKFRQRTRYHRVVSWGLTAELVKTDTEHILMVFIWKQVSVDSIWSCFPRLAKAYSLAETNLFLCVLSTVLAGWACTTKMKQGFETMSVWSGLTEGYRITPLYLQFHESTLSLTLEILAVYVLG